jgi:hypothetical protein
MAQHDYSIANASGAAVRADLNNALSAVVTLNSGATEPATMFAYMLWADTTTGLLKQRNSGNTAWITVGTMASANLGHLLAPGSAGSADQVLATDGSGVQSWVDRARLVRATAVTTTSGTNADFGSIPSWAKKISVMFNGVSTSGSSLIQVQLGDAGGIENTGYAGGSGATSAGGAASYNYTSGLVFNSAQDTSGAIRHGLVTIANVTGNTWALSGGIGYSNLAGTATAFYSKTLSDVLTQVRVTTINGTDTFDAGSINIIYEG